MFRLSNKPFDIDVRFSFSLKHSIIIRYESYLTLLLYAVLQTVVQEIIHTREYGHFKPFKMSDIYVLKKARTICSSKFSRLNNSIRNNINASSRTLVESRFAKLKDTWKGLQERHEDYLLGVEEEAKEGEESKEDMWIDKYFNAFVQTESMVDAFLAEAVKKDVLEAERKAKELENRMKIEKRGELMNASKIVELQVRNKEEKYQAAYSTLRSLLCGYEDYGHVALAVASTVMRLETYKLEVENAQHEYAKLCIQCDKEVPQTVYQGFLEGEKRKNEILNEAEIFCSKYKLP